jgi:enamine deaminase RidA (YjgF/YER057c/UK114 family)
VRRIRAAINQLAAGGAKTPIIDQLPKAVEHVKAAHEELGLLPDHVIDPDGHHRSVVEAAAHVFAAHRCLEAYRDAVEPPVIPNPEGETDPNPAAERSRAIASVILAGYGKSKPPPRWRRRH